MTIYAKQGSWLLVLQVGYFLHILLTGPFLGLWMMMMNGWGGIEAAMEQTSP